MAGIIDSLKDWGSSLNNAIISFKDLMKKISPYIFRKGNNINIAGSMVLGGANVALNISIPYAFDAAVSLLTSNDSPDDGKIAIHPLGMVALYGLAWTASQITIPAQKIIVNRMAVHSARKFGMNYLTHIMSLPLDYHLTTPFGRKMEFFKKALGMMEFVQQAFTQIIPTLIEVIVAATILSTFGSPTIGIGLVCMLSASTLYNVLAVEWINKSQQERLEADLAIAEAIFNVVENYELLSLYARTERELKQLNDGPFKNVENTFVKAMNTSDKIAAIQALIAGTGFILTAVFLGRDVQNGRISINDCVIDLIYLMQFVRTLNVFGTSVNTARASLIDIRAVFDFLEKNKLVPDPYSHVELKVSPENAKIEFNNVRFSYNDRDELFKGLSFTILPGQKVGIVGGTGAGKSTVIKLLLRFHEISSGSIKINDQDINQVGLNRLRATISLVPQMPVLLNKSLRANIVFSIPPGNQVTEDRITESVDKAGLRTFVDSLPEKMDTKMGEHGGMVSGGQRQRIAIARAVLTDTPILLLDEATSALDSETEAKIQENLDSIAEGKTTIVVTHRLNTIQNADKIIVIGDGVVLEEGSHEELLQKKSYYESLWKQQNDTKKEPNEVKLTPKHSNSKDIMNMLLEGGDSEHKAKDGIVRRKSLFDSGNAPQERLFKKHLGKMPFPLSFTDYDPLSGKLASGNADAVHGQKENSTKSMKVK